jgi:hypothetical protein
MVQFLSQQLLFLGSIGLLLFLPGLILLRAAFGKHTFTPLEYFTFSVPASIAMVNFLMIILGKAGVPLTAFNIILSLALTLGVLFLLSRLRKQDTVPDPQTPSLFSFSQTEGWAILLILTLTILIKTIYLSHAILPTATDLGHHMYWSQAVKETGQLPVYVERNIVEHDGHYVLNAPEPIDDFIIGEHLIFAAVSLLSGTSLISGYPALVLLLVSIMSLLAIFLFVLRAFAATKEPSTLSSVKVAILALFFLGPIYTLASPQAKFVSGGVIGNVLGNLFIPATLYFYWRALKEKNTRLLTFAFFLTFGLAYIHHLSTLMFLFIALAALVTFSLFHLATLRDHLTRWAKLFFSPAPLLFSVVAVVFFFFVLAPSYADPHSVDTALGSPSKSTRTGLTFLQLTASNGESRMGLGLLGFAVLLITLRQRYAAAFFFGWGAILLIMSLRPQWLFIDIPSNRISTYTTFPLAILAAVAFVALFQTRPQTSAPENSENTLSSRLILPLPLATGAFVLLLTLAVTGGFFDNGQTLLDKGKAQETLQTFAASKYLNQHHQPEDLILKDHNYITADAWMKLFFLKGYTYPLSRGYFSRYEDETSDREQCTLWMISIPNTPRGEQCFREVGVNIVVVNPHFDSTQFKKAKDFSLVYSSNDIAIYKRNDQ